MSEDLVKKSHRFDVSLSEPLGLTLGEAAADDGRGTVVYVKGVDAAGAAHAAGCREGDRVVATSATLGDAMWPKSSIAGVVSAVRSRLQRLAGRRPKRCLRDAWGRIAATPRGATWRFRGDSVETRRGDAVTGTWIFRGEDVCSRGEVNRECRRGVDSAVAETWIFRGEDVCSRGEVNR